MTWKQFTVVREDDTRFDTELAHVITNSGLEFYYDMNVAKRLCKTHSKHNLSKGQYKYGKNSQWEMPIWIVPYVVIM